MVKLVLVVEVHDAETSNEAMQILDAFREAVMPMDHGLTIYRATYDDVREFDLRDRHATGTAFVRSIYDDDDE